MGGLIVFSVIVGIPFRPRIHRGDREKHACAADRRRSRFVFAKIIVSAALWFGASDRVAHRLNLARRRDPGARRPDDPAVPLGGGEALRAGPHVALLRRRGGVDRGGDARLLRAARLRHLHDGACVGVRAHGLGALGALVHRRPVLRRLRARMPPWDGAATPSSPRRSSSAPRSPSATRSTQTTRSNGRRRVLPVTLQRVPVRGDYPLVSSRRSSSRCGPVL